MFRAHSLVKKRSKIRFVRIFQVRSPEAEALLHSPLTLGSREDSDHYVNDLHAVPPDWRNGDVRSMAKTSAVTDGSITLGVAVGSRQFIAEKLLSKADVTRATHERVQLCQDPQTEFPPPRESGSWPYQPHPAGRPHNPGGTECSGCLRRNWQRSLERFVLGLTADSVTPEATLSASQSGIKFKRARDIAAPAQLGALIAAKSRIQGMIRDAVLAGPLPPGDASL